MAKTITQLPDATVVNAADELIVQQGGVTKRATKTEVLNGIVNANVDASAAIAGTKIAPDFGQQDVSAQNINSLIFSDTVATVFRTRRARGTSASPTIVQSGDPLGAVNFQGYDGTNYIPAAVVRCEVDGTTGANDMPGRLLFLTTADGASSGTERMRINNQGDVLIGKTSVDWSLNGVQYEANNRYFVFTNTSEQALSLRRNTSNGAIVTINRDATQVGTISVTTTATAYNTSSDYRLKENPQPMVGALSRLADVKPVTFTWKSNGEQGEGFIAHELQAVVPEAVTGEKDAVDAEGNPQYQGVDASKLVPLLVAAVQELSAKVAALEASQNS